MIRFSTMALIACAMALGVSVSDAQAGKCKQTSLLTGKTKTWSCKSGQVCCSAPLIGYAGCGTKKIGGCIKL
jgi:hypothetical protein